MIKRIVRISFHPEKVNDFLNWFNTHQQHIRNFEGCVHLELWRDVDYPNIFYTFSIWENAESIEKYRQSEIFNKVWSYTKALFNDKPMAFSAIEQPINQKI